jgi:two-component system NtrC family sensor kinase
MDDRAAAAHHVPDLASLLTVGGRALPAGEVVRLNRLSLLELVVPSVAHEMNNALQVVSGLAELLGARQDLPPAVAEKVARMGAQATRASAMLRDLVAYARAEGEGPHAVDLARVAEAALALRRYHLARAQVAVAVQGQLGTCLVHGHFPSILHVLLNLLVNAEQAVAGHPRAEIRVELAAGATACEMAVIDNGTGPGADGEPPASARRGPGLGLPVADALLRSQGGTLRVEAAGPGTRAVMTLPRTAPPRG